MQKFFGNILWAMRVKAVILSVVHCLGKNVSFTGRFEIYCKDIFVIRGPVTGEETPEGWDIVLNSPLFVKRVKETQVITVNPFFNHVTCEVTVV